MDGICNISHPGLQWLLLTVSAMPHSPGFPPLWLLLLNLCRFLCSKCPCPLFAGFCWDLVSIHHPSYLPPASSLNPTASTTIFDDPRILVSSPDFSVKLWTMLLGVPHRTQHHQNLHLFWVSSERPPQPLNLPARGFALDFPLYSSLQPASPPTSSLSLLGSSPTST